MSNPTNPTTVADVESRFRPLSSQEQINTNAFIDDAWALLLGRRPNLDADIAAETVSTNNVIRVVAGMVIRVLRNPDGYLEEGIDDYRYRRDSVVSTGLLHVTDDELADLTPGRRRRRSVRLTTPLVGIEDYR